ncbi:hypothetical protein [Halocynthiibacter styelae]|uniref:Uncharacterized protein n=1 Tax=Halocynthiibacter styelae TaxID=2761955 RepID=A0A8J7IQ91_9RHOB|nr:hypothetical protein [Paenihalocynthiibacter styelae]MBI1495181.1 hypothetical protein [Paenihalocynthiibacter styelae]
MFFRTLLALATAFVLTGCEEANRQAEERSAANLELAATHMPSLIQAEYRPVLPPCFDFLRNGVAPTSQTLQRLGYQDRGRIFEYRNIKDLKQSETSEVVKHAFFDTYSFRGTNSCRVVYFSSFFPAYYVADQAQAPVENLLRANGYSRVAGPDGNRFTKDGLTVSLIIRYRDSLTEIILRGEAD